MVCNAYHIKNVPGRKTDWNDAFWIAKCLAQGLLKPSFVPDREQRELRDMVRFRKSQIEERSRNINRLQKFLEGGNIKLASWLSDVEGKSATALLELVIGKPDFTIDDVKQRMHGRMKSTSEEIFAALTGYITPSQRGFLVHVMDVIRQQTEQIEMTDAMIKSALTEEQNAAAGALDAVPGIGVISAEQIIAETGTDMARFHNQHSFSNWSGTAPGNNESAGKRKSGKSTFGNKALKSTLTQCAKSAVKNKSTFFSAQYSRLAAHRGKNRATLAVAHSPWQSRSSLYSQGGSSKTLGRITILSSTVKKRLIHTSSNSPNFVSLYPMIFYALLRNRPQGNPIFNNYQTFQMCAWADIFCRAYIPCCGYYFSRYFKDYDGNILFIAVCRPSFTGELGFIAVEPDKDDIVETALIERPSGDTPLYNVLVDPAPAQIGDSAVIVDVGGRQSEGFYSLFINRFRGRVYITGTPLLAAVREVVYGFHELVTANLDEKVQGAISSNAAAEPIPLAVCRYFQAVMLFQAVFVGAAFAEGLRLMGSQIGKQVNLPRLFYLLIA